MASTDPVRPTAPTPLASMARHWVLCTVLSLLGLLAGLGLGYARPAVTTAEARLSVAPADTSAYSIAGFPLGAQELAATYARWVQNDAAAAGGGMPGVSSLTASPIPESAVVRIEAQGTDPEATKKAVSDAAQKLLGSVSGEQSKNDPKRAYAEYQKLAPQVAAAEAAVDQASAAVGRSDTRANTKALADAKTSLALIKLRQEANGQLYKELYSNTQGISLLKEVSPAAISGNDRKSGLARMGLAGLVGGLVLAFLAATLLDRRGSRRTRTRTA